MQRRVSPDLVDKLGAMLGRAIVLAKKPKLSDALVRPEVETEQFELSGRGVLRCSARRKEQRDLAEGQPVLCFVEAEGEVERCELRED